MKITTPIVFVTFDGDVKKKVSTAKFTYVATYEAHRRETCVIVQVDLYNAKMQGVIEKQVKEFYKSYGKIKTCRYYKDGGEIIQMITNN